MLDIIMSMIKVIVCSSITGCIVIFIIFPIINKTKSKNSTVAYYNDNDNTEYKITTPKTSTATEKSNLTVSITAETSSKNSGRNWHDITQAEIDSIKCYGDNMNKHAYKIRAIYIPTNRTRTIKVRAFNEEDALSQLTSEYVKESATVSLSEYPPVTDRQIQYAIHLGIHIPEKCCQYDLSALLDQHTTEPAPVALSEYASSRNLCFSYYADEPYLIRLISSQMQQQEWIAFSLICMEKYITQKWDFSKWDEYMNFSLKCMNNTPFINSLNRTHLKNEFYGFEYSECSHNTIFFKTLYDFVIKDIST